MKYTLAAALSLCTFVILGQSIGYADESLPSADEIKRVTDYYYNQQGSEPVLADYKFCTGIQRDGLGKNNCTSELSDNTLEPGQSFYLWMNFMLPKGDKGKVLVQLNHDGVTRDTRVMDIAGSMRYRTWRKVKLLRPGAWELPVFYENDEGIAEVDRITVNVASPLDSHPLGELSLNHYVSPRVLE